MSFISYYYLHTVSTPEGLRVRPLNGQYMGLKSSGSFIDSTKNVSCNKPIRTKYPVGSVFAAKDLEWKKGCYHVKGFTIYPVENSAIGLVTVGVDGTEQSMIDDYKSFLAGRPKVTVEFDAEPFKVIPEEPKKEQSDPEDAPYPKLIDRLKKKASISPPTIDKDGFYVSDDAWYLFIRNIRYRRNTLMLGDSGTGKTEVVYWLSKKLKKQLSVFDMGAMLDPISGLLGTHRIKNKESIFDYAQFVYAVQQPNIVLLDEINRSPATASNILFPCLDSRRELPIDIADMDGTRRVKIHPDCVFFATANIGAEYTGTGIIDRALMERFFPYEMKYLPKEIEVKVLVARTKVDKGMANLICDYAQRIRDIYKRGELSIGISIRHTLEVASMVVDGFSLSTALEYVVLPVYEGTNTSGERAIIAALFSSK